jgi:hypothetical protein
MPRRLLVIDDAFPAGARDVHVTPKIVVETPTPGSFDVTLRRPDGSEVALKASLSVSHVRGPQAPFGMYRLLGTKVDDVPIGSELWSVDA